MHSTGVKPLSSFAVGAGGKRPTTLPLPALQVPNFGPDSRKLIYQLFIAYEAVRSRSAAG